MAEEQPDSSARAAKSPRAFRTISEVAAELDVPPHVLRFWESRFSQVRPMKRGGGRRYYRPEDVALLRRIRKLLYTEGYTIKGVQKLLREGGAKGAAEADTADGETAAPVASVAAPGLDPVLRAALTEVVAALEEVRDLLRAKGTPTAAGPDQQAVAKRPTES